MSGVFADSAVTRHGSVVWFLILLTPGARMIKTGEDGAFEKYRVPQQLQGYGITLKIVDVKLFSVRRVLHILYARGFIIYRGAGGHAFFPRGAGC